ncbi:hypothetical protein Tco_0215189 [Tanacetum coccineum]
MYDQWRQLTMQDMTTLLKNLLIHLANKSRDDGLNFVHELKQEMFADLEYVRSLEKEVDELESEKAIFSNVYDLLLRYTWTAFGGNTRDLGSILEETGQDYNYTQRRLEELLTEGGDGVRIPCEAV